tara:strand:+ start:14 stop:394 length:381 start_codon:yes stop_codon:yes gene_type:complete
MEDPNYLAHFLYLQKGLPQDASLDERTSLLVKEMGIIEMSGDKDPKFRLDMLEIIFQHENEGRYSETQRQIMIELLEAEEAATFLKNHKPITVYFKSLGQASNRKSTLYSILTAPEENPLTSPIKR